MAQQALIGSLGEKIDKLIEENERLRRECESLSVEGDALRRENREQKAAVTALENRVKLLELGEGLTAGTVDTKQARARINNLMREIDRCIALINR